MQIPPLSQSEDPGSELLKGTRHTDGLGFTRYLVPTAAPRAHEPVVIVARLDEAFFASVVEHKRFVATPWVRVAVRAGVG